MSEGYEAARQRCVELLDEKVEWLKERESLRQQLENSRKSATNGWNAYEDLRSASDEMIIELRQQLAETKDELASCIEDLDREVRVGNDYMKQLAECERERDELVAAAKKFCDDWKFCCGSEWPVRALQELNTAIAKLGADKTGEVG